MSPEPVVVAGITAILARHPARIELAAEADVVLYDVLGLLDGDVDELARLARQTAVLAIRRDQRPDLLDHALAQGVVGCLPLSIGQTELLAVLDAAGERAQRSPATPDEIICGCPSSRSATIPGAAAGLTARESHVLTAIARGLSNAEIADQAFISHNTVKSTIRSAYHKIGAGSRSQAVIWALQHGFDR